MEYKNDSIIGRGGSTGSRRGGVFSFGGRNSAIISNTENTTGTDYGHCSLEEPCVMAEAQTKSALGFARADFPALEVHFELEGPVALAKWVAVDML
ncbi:hypothetical protein L3X38_030248 [Prunus dulcis]|uniref:Uncharacterized protein n=1 Tax=Prunus dulcis TaxID=3755 RepID=A0AAD4VBF4_PRUDU|nr:hypothetical protein L3X38_030248 [Prunus dulcis]